MVETILGTSSLWRTVGGHPGKFALVLLLLIALYRRSLTAALLDVVHMHADPTRTPRSTRSPAVSSPDVSAGLDAVRNVPQ